MSTAEAFDAQRQRDNKRLAIIKTAALAFNQGGYEGTSLDAIASRLGVTKKALYYYVKNKHEILHAIFELWLDAQERAIDRAAKEGKSGLECLKLYARYYVTAVLSDLTPMDRIVGEMSFLDQEAVEELRQRRRRNDLRIGEFVAAANSDGSAAGWEPRLVVNVLNGSLDWMFKWFRPDREKTAEEVVDSITELIIQGVAAR